MKIIKKLVALSLTAALIFMLSACSDEKIQKKVNEYLQGEYPGKTFKVEEYTKRSDTSGRYEVDVICLDDGISFMMYIYSNISAFDSYSVEKANKTVSDLVRKEFDALYGNGASDKFKNIQWLDMYDDNAGTYKFRTVDISEDITLSDAEDIYRVEFIDGLTVADVGSLIYDFMYLFHHNVELGESFGTATFVYTLGEVDYEYTLDVDAAHELGKTGVVNKVLSNFVTSDEKNSKAPSGMMEFSTILDEE